MKSRPLGLSDGIYLPVPSDLGLSSSAATTTSTVPATQIYLLGPPPSEREDMMALSDYKVNRENGNEVDSPNRPFPEDGTYDLVEETKVAQWLDEPARKGWVRACYTEGPKDRAWMEEKDRNYLARLRREEQKQREREAREKRLQEEKMKQEWEERKRRQQIEQEKLALQKYDRVLKSRTFGMNKHSTFRSGLYYLVLARSDEALDSRLRAMTDYKDHRENGNDVDSPKRPFPEDGIYNWVKETEVAQWLDKPARKNYYRVRYTEGPKDRGWMKQKDRNYLARLRREEEKKEAQEQQKKQRQEERKKRQQIKREQEERQKRQQIKREQEERQKRQQAAEQLELEKQHQEREKRKIEQQKLALQKEREKLSQERRSFEQQKQQPSSTSQEASTSSTSQSKPAAPSARLHAMGLSTSLQINPKTLTIGRQIGEGAYGRVYLGTWHKHTGVAIKELKVSGLPETIQQAFEREAKVMANLHSPRIVRLYGVCVKVPYRIVMEYLPKGSLYDVLHSKQDLSWPMRIRIAQDTGEGLHFLHVQTPMIVHRDLKSLNVLLDKNYRAKLTDFGLAQVKQVITSTTKQHSKATQSVGTPVWMAPELFDRKPSYTAASDVYAYGMVMWELASRQLPFYEAAHASLIPIWVARGDREDIPDGTPPSYAKLITRCWDGRREQRLRVSEVISKLKNIGTEQPSGDSASAQTSTSQSGPQYDAGTVSTTSGPNYGTNLRS